MSNVTIKVQLHREMDRMNDRVCVPRILRDSTSANQPI